MADKDGARKRASLITAVALGVGGWLAVAGLPSLKWSATGSGRIVHAARPAKTQEPVPGETWAAVRLFHEVPENPIRQGTVQALAMVTGEVLASANVNPWGVARLSVPHGACRITVDRSTLPAGLSLAPWAAVDPASELAILDGSQPVVYVDLRVGAPREAKWGAAVEDLQGMLIGPAPE